MTPSNSNAALTETLADDLLRGVKAISTFIYGDAEKDAEANVRRTYHAITKGDIPVFRIGGVICARKSSILKHIADKEAAA